MKQRYIPNVVQTDYDLTVVEPSIPTGQYTTAAPVLVQGKTPEINPTAGQAFENVWLYGGTLNALYNGVTKPNRKDAMWQKQQKSTAWQMVKAQLGPRVQLDNYKRVWDNDIHSSADAGWFLKTASNKLAVDASAQAHMMTAIGAYMLDPADIVLGGIATKVGKATKLLQAIEATRGGKRVAAYASVGASAGAMTQAPQVAWNYQDDTAILTGALMGASLYAFAGKLTDKDMVRLANRRRIDDNAQPKEALKTALDNPKQQVQPKAPADRPPVDEQAANNAFHTAQQQDGSLMDYDAILDDASVPVEEIKTGTKADQLLNPPKTDNMGNELPMPTDYRKAKFAWYQKLAYSFLGQDYEVHKIWKELAQSTMTLAHLGKRKVHGSTSIAKQNYNYITANHIAKFEQLVQQRIPSFFPRGALGQAKQALGKNTQVMHPQVRGAYQRQAVGYMASKYNYESAIAATNKIVDRINEALGSDLPDFDIEATRRAVLGSPQALKEYVDEANAHIRRLNAQTQQKYDEALRQYRLTSTLKDAQGKRPDPPQKPVLIQEISLPVDLLDGLVKPDINSIPGISQALVACYEQSGISRALGKVLREAGQDFIESDDYFHLTIDPNRFDELARNLVSVVQQRNDKQLRAAQTKLRKLYSSLGGKQKGYKRNPTPQREAQILQIQQKIQQTRRQISIIKSKNQNDYLMQAYQDLFHDYGEQIYQALMRAKGSEFRHLKAEQIGALLIVSRLRDAGGHDALFKALQRQRKIMGDNLNTSILNEIAQATNTNFNEVSKQLADRLDLADLTYHATAERRTDNMSVIGQSNMLKRRYREDYMRRGSKTGLAPYEFLDANIYKGAQDMVREETARASLMGRRVLVPGAKQVNGKYRYEDILDLGTPQGLTRAGKLLHDRAKQLGYDQQTALNMQQMWLNSVLGRPLGAPEQGWMQVLRSIAGTMFLKNSGLFNLADVAQLCLDTSYRQVAKAMIPAMKMGVTFGKLSRQQNDTIRSMLAKTLAAEGRLVPSMQRVGDDLQDVSKNRFVAGVNYFAQYGRFANASEFIRNWENNMGAIIYETRLLDALKKGEQLQEIPYRTMALAQQEFAKHGQDFAKWDQNVKRAVIGAGDEIMSNIILSIRAGERPRFLSGNVGRFVFAYQSFVFAAHKKLLMRYINEYGMLRLTHLIAIQMAAGVGIVAMANMLDGRDPTKMTPEKFGVQLGTSVSALGLIGAAVTAVSRGQIGGTYPGLGAATAIAKLPANIAQGDFAQAYKATPVAAVFLPLRAAVAALTGDF